MSDYLTNAANRADPVAPPAIRPRVRSVFEGTAKPAISEPLLETPLQPIRAISPAPPDPPPDDFRPPAFAPLENSPPVGPLEPEASKHISQPFASPPAVHAIRETVVERPFLESPRAPSPLSKSELISPSVAAPPDLPQISPKSPPQLKNSPPGEILPPHFHPLPAPLLATPKAELRPAPPEPTQLPPAVNVTIGRLEIRAAPIPEKPRHATQPAARGPLPLDDFLRSKSPRPRTTA